MAKQQEKNSKKEQQSTQPKRDENANWYVLRVFGGRENKIKKKLEREIEHQGWDKVIKDILIPTEKVYKIRGGKKVTKERNFFPGYILMQIDPENFTEDMVQHLQNINQVISFLDGGEGEPIPLKKSEVNRILGKVDEAQEEGESMKEPFIVGETVKIIDGPFNDFNGKVEEVNEDKKKLKVMVKIFGRNTPVELNFMQVEKIQ